LNQYAFSAAGLHIKDNEQFTWNHIIFGIEKVLIQSTAGRFETRISIANRFPSSVSFYFLNQKRLSSSRAFMNFGKKFVKESFEANPAGFTMAVTGVLSAVGSCAYTISIDVQKERQTERRHQEQMALQRAVLASKNTEFRQFDQGMGYKEKDFDLRAKVYELEKKKFEETQKLAFSSTDTPMVPSQKSAENANPLIPSALEQYSFYPSQLCSKYEASHLLNLFF
jgi:hypothetical protein